MKLSSLEAYEVLVLVQREISKLASEEILTNGEGVSENVRLLRLIRVEQQLDAEYRKQTKREGLIARWEMRRD